MDNIIKITNQRLWWIEQEGYDIDDWLREHIGIRNYHERIGITQLPYRAFVFMKDEDAVLFTMRWL